jgi:hypothetical protein
MTEESEPGRPRRTGFRSKVIGENPADHVFIDFYAEGESNLLGNSTATPTTVTPFHLKNCIDEFFLWPFRTGPASTFG